MKRVILIAGFFSFLLSVAFADEVELPHVTVYGTATKQVKVSR